MLAPPWAQIATPGRAHVRQPAAPGQYVTRIQQRPGHAHSGIEKERNPRPPGALVAAESLARGIDPFGSDRRLVLVWNNTWQGPERAA